MPFNLVVETVIFLVLIQKNIKENKNVCFIKYLKNFFILFYFMDIRLIKLYIIAIVSTRRTTPEEHWSLLEFWIIFKYWFIIKSRTLVLSQYIKKCVPAYELDKNFPYYNDNKLEDKGCPSLSFDRIFSIDIHQPSEH